MVLGFEVSQVCSGLPEVPRWIIANSRSEVPTRKERVGFSLGFGVEGIGFELCVRALGSGGGVGEVGFQGFRVFHVCGFCLRLLRALLAL